MLQLRVVARYWLSSKDPHMLKKIVALAGATALAGTGIALAAGPAQAAPAHAPGSIFIHGTTKLAKFSTRTNCEAHAVYELKLVVKNANTTPLGAVQRTNATGPELRFSCYPLRSGEWSYLTAYTSKNGAPIQSQDLYFNPATRAAQKFAGTNIDSQSVYAFAHVTVNQPGTKTSTCNGQLDFIVKKILRSPSLRLIATDKTCVVAGGRARYESDYASTTRTGLPYDKVATGVTAEQPMLDALGYKYPGQSAALKTNSTQQRKTTTNTYLAWR